MMMASALLNTPVMEPYTIYDYLVTDGNTCFATGYTPNSSTSIAPVFGELATTGFASQYLVYCNGFNMDVLYNKYGYTMRYLDGSKYYEITVSDKTDNDVYWKITSPYYAHKTLTAPNEDFDFYSYTSTVRGSSNTASSTTYNPLYIFGNGSGRNAIAGIKFYRLKIREGGMEVRNFFPAVDNATGNVGLIEPFTGQFILPMNGNPSIGNL